MRLRNAAVALIGGLALVISVSQPSSAATGNFTYKYVAGDGTTKEGVFTDPNGGECFDIPEAADPESTQPAHTPVNRTTATATVFADAGCEGDFVVLKELTGKGSENTKFRSASFSS
ncbi:hypothetical protein [Streptomyces sp. NPDC089919]|uniref:hypothetical protein n=1 Tax=Streptomyces sp. NPDC089919 TaxID=3155188 RepID=UPI0034413166